MDSATLELVEAMAECAMLSAGAYDRAREGSRTILDPIGWDLGG